MTGVEVVSLIGSLVLMIGSFMIAAAAFRESAIWGLGVIFIPFLAIVYAARNWEECRRGASFWIGGVVIAGIAGGMGAVDRRREPSAPAPAVSRAEMVPLPRADADPFARADAPRVPARPTSESRMKSKAVEPETRKQLEQVYIDRATNLYYPEKCKKRPESLSRVAKSVARMQGYREAVCK